VTRELRWRIVTLQVVLLVVLGVGAGLLFWSANFVNGMVHDELVSQRIYFPPASEIRSGGALDPAEYSAEVREYAGQQVDNGDKARVYANDFIAVHLNEIAGGKTYSQVSAQAQANPTNLALAAQANTLFRGETLRGLLLNAWGWSQVAMYAFYAAIFLAVAALVVLGALIFELVTAPRSAREARSTDRLTA
jgi:hypothetical protein